MAKLKFTIIMVALLLTCTSIGSVSAATYKITNQSYNNYFDEFGYINNTKIASGDVFDCSGAINNRDMYIDRPLTITSSSKTGKILNGTITVLSEGSGTKITNLFFNNTNHNGFESPGTIVLYGADNCTITNNTIITNQTGDDSYGIHLMEASNNKILKNKIVTTGDGTGTATGAAVDDTGWPGNGKFTYGVFIELESSNNLLESNTIRTTGNAATVDWSGWINEEGGVYPIVGVLIFDKSNGNTLKNNTIITNYNQIGGVYDTILGVQIKRGSSNNKLTGNNITTKGHSYAYGVEIVGEPDSWSKNNTVSGNNIDTVGDSIYANGIKVSANTEDTFISKNNISAVAPTFAYAVYLEDFTGKTVKNIIVSENNVYAKAYVVYVFELWYASGHTITKNNITGEGKYTIGIATHESNNNTITYNRIITTGDGNAPMIPNVDAITALNAAIKLQAHSNGNYIALNTIVQDGGEFTIYIDESSMNMIIDNQLDLNNGSIFGNDSIFSKLYNIIRDNFGLKVPDNPSKPEDPTVPDNPSKPEDPTAPDNPSNPDNPSVPDNSSKNQTNSTISNTTSNSGSTPSLTGTPPIAAYASAVIGQSPGAADGSSSPGESSKVYELSQKDSSSSNQSSLPVVAILVCFLILAGLLALGFFRNTIKGFFK